MLKVLRQPFTKAVGHNIQCDLFFFIDFKPRNVYHCWGMLIALYRQMQLAVCVLGHLPAAEQI